MAEFKERDLDNVAFILDCCDKIAGLIERFGCSYKIFMNDYAFKDSLLMNVFQIGEAVNRISDEFKTGVPDVPWHQIYATRNIIAHGYVKIDDFIIWKTIINDIPDMKEKLKKLID